MEGCEIIAICPRFVQASENRLRLVGMASPLIGIAGVNSLLFTSYAVSKRIISPFPELSLKEIAAAGAMAGAANSVLASPGTCFLRMCSSIS